MNISRISLRTRLLGLIIIPLLVIVTALSAIRYSDAAKITEITSDKLLFSIAQVIARDIILTEGDLLTEELLETFTSTHGDQVFYHIHGETDTHLLTGYAQPPEPKGLTIQKFQPIFYNATYLKKDVRVVAFRDFVTATNGSGWVTIYVWQTNIARNNLLLDLAGRSLITLLIMVFLTALVVWFSINYGLKPLLDLQNSIQKRSPEDLTEIKRTVPKEAANLVDSMNKLFAQLKLSIVEKDEFIADVAHQLRNPVAAVISHAESAQRSKTPEQTKQRIDDTVDTAKEVGRITQQLLSMEHVSRKNLVAKLESFNMVSLLQKRLAAILHRADDSNTKIIFEDDHLSFMVMGQESLLGEAVDNLLDNALSYGCKDGGIITVSISSKKDNTVEINIFDNGNGIDQELMPKLFDRFTRGADVSDSGSGLGLAIAKKIIEIHDGTLTIESSIKGTNAKLLLPLSINNVNTQVFI